MRIKAPFRVSGFCSRGFSIEAFCNPYPVASRGGTVWRAVYVHCLSVWNETHKPGKLSRKMEFEQV